MTHHVPIVDGLLEARDDASRAGWLLRCPLEILLREETLIRAELERQRFSVALHWLDVECSAARAVRDKMGQIPRPIEAQLRQARAGLFMERARLTDMAKAS